MHRRTHGFTLIEILIVLTILGILAALVAPKYVSAAREAREARLKTELQTIRRQIERYKVDHAGQLPDLTAGWTSLTESHMCGARTCGPYLFEIPTNPLNGLSNVKDSPAEPGTSIGYSAAGFIFDMSGLTGRLSGTTEEGTVVFDDSPATP